MQAQIGGLRWGIKMTINIDVMAVRRIEKLPPQDRLREAALMYARGGARVMPLLPNSKMPALESWSDASSDPALIEEWFGKNGKFSKGNIALFVNGFKVIDIDRHGNVDGFKTLAGALDNVACPRSLTPNNGQHLLASKTDIKDDPSNGVEVLGEGRLFTVYPSEIDGKRYLWQMGGTPSPVQRIRPVESALPSATATPVAPAGYVRSLLEHIDPDIDYGTWLKVGMAIHHNDAGEMGLTVWDEWSQGGRKYKQEETERRWKTFDAARGKPVGLRWLIIEALKNGKPQTKEDIIYHGNLFNAVEIDRVNEKYGLYDSSGELYVVYKERGQIHFATPFNFRIKIADWKVEIDGKLKPMADVWLEHPDRRIVTEVGMWMPKDVPEGAMNSYEGFAVEPVECQPEDVQMFLDFVHNDVCRGDERHSKFLLDMLAKKVQHPMALMKICLVLRGGEGAGKGTLTRIMENIIGPRHSANVSSADSWLGKYSGTILKSTIWLSANEAHWSGNHQQSERLKALVTEEYLDLEEKFVNIRKQRNRLFIAITTNNKWSVPASHDSRRYFVLDVPNIRTKDDQFWEEFNALMGANEDTHELNNPEYLGKVLYYLQNRKITSNLRWALETKWLQEQRRETAIESREEAFIQYVRQTFVSSNYTDVLSGAGGGQWPILNRSDNSPCFRADITYDDYRAYINKHHKKPRMMFTMASFIESMELLGFEAKRVVKDRLTMGGHALPGPSGTGSKILVMRLQTPQQIEDAIDEKFTLFGTNNIGVDEE